MSVLKNIATIRPNEIYNLSAQSHVKVSFDVPEYTANVDGVGALRILDAMNADQLDCVFAGHTHGGQVRLPWPGGSKALTTNCDLPNWRARGITKTKNEPWLNVSAGMGTSPFERLSRRHPRN